MTTSDWMIVCATILGPVLAVQAQRYVDEFRAYKSRRMQVFHSLMATRDARLAPLHIESLNRIDTDFDPRQNYWWSQKQRGKDRAVIEAWRMYWKHLNTATEEDMRRAWSEKSASLFFELLHSMSVAVGQSFTRFRTH